jgi:hypothetical protein
LYVYKGPDVLIKADLRRAYYSRMLRGAVKAANIGMIQEHPKDFTLMAPVITLPQRGRLDG